MIFLVLTQILRSNCQQGENIPSLNAINDILSTTSDPRDAFLAAVENAPVLPDEIPIVGNFDREPQSPTPAPPRFPPTNQFNDRNSLTPNIFEPPTRDRDFTRLNVDEFGNPLGDVLNTDTTRYELGAGANPDRLRCPRNWVEFKGSCYKFNRSPPKEVVEAREICQSYRHDDTDRADLVSISDAEEHWFLSETLNRIDPEHRRWYISARQDSKNQWINEGDGTRMLNLQDYFLDPNEFGELQDGYKKDHLTYSFSLLNRRWGFQPVYGHEKYLYICEVPIEEVNYLINDDRTAAYGQPLGDPRFIPMGPFFVRQPNHTVFDLSRRNIVNDVSLLCIAQGWPTPSYEWFKELYKNDLLEEVRVDPLEDTRLTISGGQLIINNPDQTKDKGTYFCTASNQFGKIRSKSVSLSFGFIGEFILRRSDEQGNENWGKAVKCDAPHYYPNVRFYWARDYFPNFVEEDRRIMVSQDGYIYFSALEKIDRGNYSCSVQSSVGNNGRNGPFFELQVTPKSVARCGQV